MLYIESWSISEVKSLNNEDDDDADHNDNNNNIELNK